MVSQTYLGRNVIINDGANKTEGLVTAVEKNEEGIPHVIVNGNSYDPSLISKLVWLIPK